MGAIAAMIGSGCCCDGTPCGVCDDAPTTVAVESTLEFDWGFPADCASCCEGMVHASFSADIGTVNVGLSMTGIVTNDWPTGLWDTPEYPDQTQNSPCFAEFGGFPCGIDGPWFGVAVSCVQIDGVAYGEVRIKLWRVSFTITNIGTIKYRKRVEGPDCVFPLGVYDYAEHDFDWEDCTDPFTSLEVIRNISFGSVTLS